VGAVHQRVEGSDRRLRRDPQGDQARPPGVRPPARRLPAPPRAGQERVPPAQHLRALHRGGRGGLRAAEGRQAGQGEAQGAAPEDRHPAHGRRADRRDPGPRGRTRRAAEGEAPALPDAAAGDGASAAAPAEAESPPARRTVTARPVGRKPR
jgi:hypothetical protein